MVLNYLQELNLWIGMLYLTPKKKNHETIKLVVNLYKAAIGGSQGGSKPHSTIAHSKLVHVKACKYLIFNSSYLAHFFIK